MKNTRLYWYVFIVALAVFVSLGCGTTPNTGIVFQEGAMEAVPQITVNRDDVGQRIQDASISSAIKMVFSSDELLSGSDINVDTSDRNVTFKGKVDSQAEADRAMLLGRSVDGVRSVHSNLIVKR